MTDVSTGLRNMMKLRKLTISELADESNIPEDTIKSIRSGKTRNPGIQTISFLPLHAQRDPQEFPQWTK